MIMNGVVRWLLYEERKGQSLISLVQIRLWSGSMVDGFVRFDDVVLYIIF